MTRAEVLLGPLQVARRSKPAPEAGFDRRSALVEVRRVYRIGQMRPLTGPAYDAGRHASAVSAQSLTLSFGSWAAVCAAAEIVAASGRRAVYERE